MYDDVLFPVSFYFLDDDALSSHGRAIATCFDARIHVLSILLEDESRSDRQDHEEAFERFVAELDETDARITSEFREEPTAYDDVPSAIVDETDDFDLVVMGHTRVREGQSGERTAAERVINASTVPTLVVPLKTPRFRGVE